MGRAVRVPKRFYEDFMLVMRYYGCDEEEINYEKERARERLEEAMQHYAIVASRIRERKMLGDVAGA